MLTSLNFSAALVATGLVLGGASPAAGAVGAAGMVAPERTVSVSTHVGNGTVTGSGTFAYGTPVTVTAVPDAGFVFGGWLGGSTAVRAALTEATSEFTMPRYNVALHAIFISTSPHTQPIPVEVVELPTTVTRDVVIELPPVVREGTPAGGNQPNASPAVTSPPVAGNRGNNGSAGSGLPSSPNAATSSGASSVAGSDADSTSDDAEAAPLLPITGIGHSDDAEMPDPGESYPETHTAYDAGAVYLTETSISQHLGLLAGLLALIAVGITGYLHRRQRQLA